jgi:hypothetical protein
MFSFEVQTLESISVECEHVEMLVLRRWISKEEGLRISTTIYIRGGFKLQYQLNISVPDIIALMAHEPPSFPLNYCRKTQPPTLSFLTLHGILYSNSIPLHSIMLRYS